jgi:hypothetical protein
MIEVADDVIRVLELRKLRFLLAEAPHVGLGFIQQSDIAPPRFQR